MKSEIKRIPNASNLGEVKLFEAMQGIIIAKGYPCVFSKKVHQHYVHFLDSQNHWARCEIADLLLVSLDRATKRCRLSFLQAKRMKKDIQRPGYVFRADLRQFDLLSNRPYVRSPEFPPWCLNFSPARSLTTYGVFYNDQNNDVDFYYAATDYLVASTTNGRSCSLQQNQKAGGSSYKRDFYVNDHVYYDETTIIDGMDRFESDLLTWEIGAVLPREWQEPFLKHLFGILWYRLNQSVFAPDGRQLEIVQRMMDYYEVGFFENESEREWAMHMNLPSIMIVESNSKERVAEP